MDYRAVLQAAQKVSATEAKVASLREALRLAQQELVAAHDDLAKVVQAAAESSSQTVIRTPALPTTSGPRRRGRSRDVLTFLREGVERDWSAEQVAEALQVPDKVASIRTALGRLVTDGQAVRTSPGRFQSVYGVHAEAEYDGDPGQGNESDDDLEESSPTEGAV